MAFLEQNVTISGLMGKVGGVARAMAGPATTGALALTHSHAELDTVGDWNLETGTLVVKVVADSIAGATYTFSFDLVNPASAQDKANVTLSISGMCFPDVAAVTPSSADLAGQGECGSFDTTLIPPGAAPAFAGTSAGEPYALNPKPQTLNPKLLTSNPKPKFQTPDPSPLIPSTKPLTIDT